MGLLDKLGLAPKRARPVGQKLEKGRLADPNASRRNNLVKAAILLTLLILTFAAFPREDAYHFLVQAGDEWRDETLVAPFDFTIYKDQADVNAERQQVRFETEPIFRPHENALSDMAANRDTVVQQLERILDAYVSYRYNLQMGRPAEATRDSVNYHELRRISWLKATPEQWQLLTDTYAASQLGEEQQPVNGVAYESLVAEAWEFGVQLVNHGVMDVPLDSVRAENVIISYPEENTEELVDKDSLFGLNEAYDAANRHFRDVYAGQPAVASLTYSIFRAIFVPTFVYQREYTWEKIQRRERTIWLTEGGVQEGETIVRRGETVTPETQRKLASLERAARERGGNVMIWRTVLGQFLLAIATYVLFFLYLFLLRRQIFTDNRQILLVSLLFAGIIGLYAIALRLPSVAMFVVPVAIASVLLTVVFDSRVGILGTLTLALLGGIYLRYDFEFTFATIFAGTLGVFSVRDIKNRGQFFLSAGLVFAGYLVVLIASWLVYDTSLPRFMTDLLMVGINSFLLIMAYPLLWVFERAFDVTTDLTLLELSDTNRPLLKELSLRAPGTFNHTLQVANLAEAAADAIGANALLTRVGALYHDIGKMLKPEYFVENQRPGDNPHDHLKPRMSALIIASHVKEGLELGRQYNLPQRVLRFIPMHHGTTRIEYFYRKAVEQRKPEEPQVQESEFRYPGPRPDSKETGILILSDSVEAASRSLSDPTHKRLETLIDMIFKARIDDGQLDYTELTFRDLNLIKETFLSMLIGIYHVRVKYPGQKEQLEKIESPAIASDGSQAARLAIGEGTEESDAAGSSGPRTEDKSSTNVEVAASEVKGDVEAGSGDEGNDAIERDTPRPDGKKKNGIYSSDRDPTLHSENQADETELRSPGTEVPNEKPGNES